MRVAERQARALQSELLRRQARRPVVAQHPELAEAVVALQEALNDLLTTSVPSPWRAAGRLLGALASPSEDFDGWDELLDEVNEAHNNDAVDRIEYAMNAVLHQLILLTAPARPSPWGP